MGNNIDQLLFRFWAKTTQDVETRPRAYHPLFCHMVDVAAVALQMWRQVLPEVTKQQIALTFGLAPGPVGIYIAGTIVAWIAGMHDLGKASPPFAMRADSPSTRLLHQLYEDTVYKRPRGLLRPSDAPHGYVTAEALPEILTSGFGFPPSLANQIGAVVGGHHGIF